MRASRIHNNALLRNFLDRFGFDYEFRAASRVYADGGFDGTMKAVLRHYGAIMDVMLPTLGEERRKTYSPVFPIHPETGKVLQVAVEVVDADAGIVAYLDPETGARRGAVHPRRAGQAAMEGRLGATLGRVRR